MPRRLAGTVQDPEWKLKENDLEPGQANKVHTAFTFEYGGQPFFMEVLVKGGLRKLHHRFKQNLKSMRFGPRPKKSEDVLDSRWSTLTMVGDAH